MTAEQKAVIKNAESQSAEEHAAVESGLSSDDVLKRVEELKQKRKDGKFYLQDFLDDINRATAMKFRKICDAARKGLTND